MRQSWRLRANRRIVIQALVFAACCAFAFQVHSIVAADTLDDVPVVGLQSGVLVAFIGALSIAVTAAYRARTLAERVTARVLPIGLLLTAAVFVKTSYADASIALHAIAAADSDQTPTSVVLGPGGRDVRLSGELKEGAARRLAALLDANPRVERIHLTSEGGLVEEGEALRQVIAAHRLTTFVPDYCVSACTLAFLGGHERLMMEGARIGFHAPYEEGLFGQTFAGDIAAERSAYIAAGAAPDFVDEAMKVAPADIWTPDAHELAAAHVTTGVVDRYRFPDSNLDGTVDVAGARAAILRNFPLARAIDEWKPRAVNVIAAWYLDAYRHGASEGQVVDGLKAVVGGAASIALASADDENMLGLGRYLAMALDAAQTEAACVAIGERADILAAENVLDRGDGSADKLAIALLARALRTPRPVTATPTAQPQPAPEAIDIGLHEEGRPCSEMRALYADLLQRPRGDAAASIRMLATRSNRLSPLALSVVAGRY